MTVFSSAGQSGTVRLKAKERPVADNLARKRVEYMVYHLTSSATESDWIEYHGIRRTVLWGARGKSGDYNDNHPDERKANHFPKLLLHNGVPIGVVRVDLHGKTAWLRRVAITEALQRNGHGGVLLSLAERFAQQIGAERIESSVDENAIPFYRKCGYKSHEGQPETAMRVVW